MKKVKVKFVSYKKLKKITGWNPQIGSVACDECWYDHDSSECMANRGDCTGGVFLHAGLAKKKNPKVKGKPRMEYTCKVCTENFCKIICTEITGGDPTVNPVNGCIYQGANAIPVWVGKQKGVK